MNRLTSKKHKQIVEVLRILDQFAKLATTDRDEQPKAIIKTPLHLQNSQFGIVYTLMESKATVVHISSGKISVVPLF